ncbi:MAG: class I SAM-dependent methyltransferase [Nitrospira sp.]
MNYEPDNTEKFRIVMNNYRMFGLWTTMKSSLAYYLSQLPQDDFDRKYGVATTGYVEPDEAGIADETARIHAIRYAPTREEVMRHLLHNSLKSVTPKEFAFIDLGCGMGRVLFIAARFPFSEIIGVELSPIHCETAIRNRDRFLSQTGPHVQCRNIRVECANVLTFAFPHTNLMIYMYRPFLEPIFSGVLDRLCEFQRTTGRKVLIAYSCPLEEGLLEKHRQFVKVQECQVISLEHSWSLWECQAALRCASNARSVGNERTIHTSHAEV